MIKRHILFTILLSTTILHASISEVPINSYKIKKKTAQLNNMLIFDLFMNLELTEKNYNLAAIVDYIPSLNKKKIQEIKWTSNLGHSEEEVYFRYGSDNRLIAIDYNVDRKDNEGLKLFRYTFEYENGLLQRIKIKNKIKYLLKYDAKNVIKSITLMRRGSSFIYNFEYIKNGLRAKLRLDTIVNGKVKMGHEVHKKDISWTYDFKLLSYEIYRYKTKHIRRNAHGDIANFSYQASMPKDAVTWKYTYDKKDNWIKRVSGKSVVERQITYQ